MSDVECFMSLQHSHPLTGEGRALGTGMIKCVERQRIKQKKLIIDSNAFSLAAGPRFFEQSHVRMLLAYVKSLAHW